MATAWLGAIPPPPGVTPNFVDPPSQKHGNIALHTVCLSLVTISVAVRLYTRKIITKQPVGVDDYLCIFSYMCTITFSGLMIHSYVWGIGRHMWDEPVLWIPIALKYFTIAQYIYQILSCAIKLTFLSFYYRLFSAQPKTRFFIVFGMVFVLVSNTALLFATIFNCTPVAHAWNVMIPGHCRAHPQILPYTSGGISLFTDLYILVLPMPSLWGLHLNLPRKARLITLFGLGAFACVASMIRIIKTPVLHSSADATWNISEIAIWAVIEVNVGLIISSSTLLPAFFDRHWPKAINSSVARFWSNSISRKHASKGDSDTSPSSREKHAEGKSREKHDFVELHDSDGFPSVLHGTNSSRSDNMV